MRGGAAKVSVLAALTGQVKERETDWWWVGGGGSLLSQCQPAHISTTDRNYAGMSTPKKRATRMCFLETTMQTIEK